MKVGVVGLGYVGIPLVVAFAEGEGAAPRRLLQGRVGVTRESPALKIIRLLRDLGADISYHDPTCRSCRIWRRTRSARGVAGDGRLVCIVTAHPSLDYREMVERSALVLDFRGVTRDIEAPNLVR
jgi:UDP-N-acetyl-D-glucosamine dehydrogenase